MTKLFISFLIFISIIYQNIDQINTLRCAHACPVGPVALGTSDPIKNPCNTIEVNTATTVCSVFLTINFQTSFIHGTLTDKRRSEDKTSILHLSSILNPYNTMTFINYYCTNTDDCDQDFVSETISTSKWFQYNSTKVHTDITSLLFKTNSSTENVICANDLTCSSNENCYAELFQNSSKIDIKNKFPCNSASASQIMIEQNFKSPNEYRDRTINIYCNKDQCNQQTTLEQIYNIIQNDFTLPLNYSTYMSNGSYRINGFLTIFLIFINLYR